MFERRHAIIHKGGRATKKYLAATRRTDIVADQPLISDAEYVRSAIDQLLVLGYLLATSVWRKFVHAKSTPEGGLLDVSPTECSSATAGPQPSSYVLMV